MADALLLDGRSHCRDTRESQDGESFDRQNLLNLFLYGRSHCRDKVCFGGKGKLKKRCKRAQVPPEALRGGISKVNFQGTLSSFGDKCPRNGSKNEQRAPRTSMGCPHIGPFVDEALVPLS